jgi:PEGA domain
MHSHFHLISVTMILISFCVGMAPSPAQDNKVMGEVKFEGATKVDRDAGVWVDGEYVGYVKELKDDKKVMLLPGKHHIVAKEAGYNDFVQDVVVEPKQVQTLAVQMTGVSGAETPKVTSDLKLTIEPARAAVFVDDKYVGHAGELGGAVHTLQLPPGKHRIKVELAGYRTFDTEMTLIAGQKSEVKTELVKGGIEDAGPEIKKQ